MTMTQPAFPSSAPSSANAVPLSAMPVIAVPTVAAPLPPSWRERALRRLQPAATYGALFLMGLSGGLAVATVSSLTLHYFARAHDRQLAEVRIDLPRPAAEPLAVEIQKAKAELDAAVAPHGS